MSKTRDSVFTMLQDRLSKRSSFLVELQTDKFTRDSVTCLITTIFEIPKQTSTRFLKEWMDENA